ncbi:MAG TPA: SMI1/KNR4 family protein [Tepidisphaeraceae bacterium]|nr:SMI1/KNR4 family protein [Tepidisphaeraceae bacterium]
MNLGTPPCLHPVLARQLDAAVEVWHGLYADEARRAGTAVPRPTDSDVELAEAELGMRLPRSYVYFCRLVVSALPMAGHLKVPAGGALSIAEHNRMLRANGHPVALVAFWEGDDGDFCFDTSGAAAAAPADQSLGPPVVYVDHWADDGVTPVGRHFLDWVTGTLLGEIRIGARGSTCGSGNCQAGSPDRAWDRSPDSDAGSRCAGSSAGSRSGPAG